MPRRGIFPAVLVSVTILFTPLVATFESAATRLESSRKLLNDVEQHMMKMSGEVIQLFVHFCKPSDVGALIRAYDRIHGKSTEEVEVPSCSELREAGLEEYYGNINMLLVEAWRGKIIASLQSLTKQPELPLPSAELLLVREPADDMAAGGIFITQLIQKDADGKMALAPSALMIGIHRMPRHKMLSYVDGAGRRPAVNVTPAIVERAQQWIVTNELRSLLVCPLAGDGGALRARLVALGFREHAQDSPYWGPHTGRLYRYKLGTLDLAEDVCQEAGLMAWSPQEKDEL